MTLTTHIPRGAVTPGETFIPLGQAQGLDNVDFSAPTPTIQPMSLNDDFGGLDVTVTHHWVEGEVYSKRTEFAAGVVLGQHAHKYDHASALVRGTVRLEVDGETRTVTGPKILLIEAGKQHRITSLTPVVWHCIHIASEGDPDSIDAGLIA